MSATTSAGSHDNAMVNEHIKALAELDSSGRSAHKRIDGAERRLDSLDCKVDKLERSDERNATNIGNLCARIDGLITTIKWAMGIIGASALGFAIWMLQQMLSK